MSSRPRTATLLLSIALLAAAGLSPAAAGAPDVTTVEAEVNFPIPDVAQAERFRERVAQVVAAESQGAALTPQTAAQALVMNPEVVRHAGTDRFGTAAALADYWWRDRLWNPEVSGWLEHPKTVFVASGENFPDALSAGPLAARAGGPVLLVKKDSIPAATKASLAGLQPTYIVVIGGTAAVSDAVMTALTAYVAAPWQVERVGYRDRWETTAWIANLMGESPRAYVALGTNWPDGLSGGAAAGWELAPLVITKSDDVPEIVMDSLRHRTRPSEIILVGGTRAVSDKVKRELETIAPVTRISGADRYAVAAEVAKIHETSFGATVASGQNWPDALAGSAFAGLTGDKLLLLRSGGVPLDTRHAVLDHSLGWIEALGGTRALPEAVLEELRALEIQLPEESLP